MINKLNLFYFFSILYRGQEMTVYNDPTTTYYEVPIKNNNKKQLRVEKRTFSLKENNFLKEVMEKFIKSICLSIGTSLIIAYSFPKFFETVKDKKEAYKIFIPLLSTVIILLILQVAFVISSSNKNLILTQIFFYLKAMFFGLILNFIYVIYPKKDISLAFISTLMVFVVSYIVGCLIEKDLTSMKTYVIIGSIVISLLALTGLIIKCFTSNYSEIRSYMNGMSIGLCLVSIFISMFFISYVFNQIKLHYEKINPQFVENNYDYYECTQYVFADELSENFKSIFLNILDIMSKMENKNKE